MRPLFPPAWRNAESSEQFLASGNQAPDEFKPTMKSAEASAPRLINGILTPRGLSLMIQTFVAKAGAGDSEFLRFPSRYK